MACGRQVEAEVLYRQAISLNPNYAEAYSHLGNALKDLGRLTDAEDACRQAICFKPSYAEAYSNLGIVLQDRSFLIEAEKTFRLAISLNPFIAEAHNNLGTTYHELCRYEEAEVSYRRSLELKPDYFEAYCNLGKVFSEFNRLEKAEVSYCRALEFKPDHAELHINLGNVLFDMDRLVEAETSYRRALEIKPDNIVAHVNLGNMFYQLDKAVTCYHSALVIKPDYANAYNNLLFTLDMMPDANTRSLQAERKHFDLACCSSLYGTPTFTNIPDPERCLRIGYVSADFREHSAAVGFGAMLTRFDTSRFEVYAYSNSNKEDEITSLFKQHVSNWRKIVGMSDSAVADMIREDGIDILVDLSGHSAGNRLLVFARKPAPVQITAWGYATGTGMKAMDAFFADAVIVSEDEKQYYAEEVRYLPCALGAFFPRPFPAVNQLPSLTTKRITFGSLNLSLIHI